MSGSAFAPYFSRWRQVALGSRVVVEGCVDPAHAGPSEELQRAIGAWPGHHYWQRRDGDRWLLLVQEPDAPRERWWLHLLLLVATLATTALAAATWQGASMERSALLDAIVRGLPFAVPFLAILAAHELGHYVAARRYRVDVSPPYFIPVLPPALNLVGSLGALVRLRSPIYDRRTLFDVGVAGPAAGLALSIPVLAYGLARSTVAATAAAPFAHQFVTVDGRALFLGDSPLLYGIRSLLAGGASVLELHPAAVAGWAGLFVTVVNLLPVAQFDGGHLAFAALGRSQRWVAWATFAALVALGALYWPGWWAWALLALLAGRGRLSHPRLVSAVAPLDRNRRWVGVLAIVAFALCFAPIPAQWR